MVTNVIKYASILFFVSCCQKITEKNKTICFKEGFIKKTGIKSYERINGIVLGYYRIMDFNSLRLSRDTLQGKILKLVPINEQDVPLFEQKEKSVNIPFDSCYIFQVSKNNNKFSRPLLIGITNEKGEFSIGHPLPHNLFFFSAEKDFGLKIYNTISVEECSR